MYYSLSNKLKRLDKFEICKTFRLQYNKYFIVAWTVDFYVFSNSLHEFIILTTMTNSELKNSCWYIYTCSVLHLYYFSSESSSWHRGEKDRLYEIRLMIVLESFLETRSSETVRERDPSTDSNRSIFFPKCVLSSYLDALTSLAV